MLEQTHKVYHSNRLGIIFMLLHALAVAVLFSAVKLLTKNIGSAQVVFFYKATSLLLILPWVFRNGFINLKTKRVKTYIIASIFGTSASLCLMYGIKYLPLANVTSLGYMEKILLILIGIFYFKEKVNLGKVLAILLAISGAIIVVYPYIGFASFNYYYLFIFASIILWVAYCLIIKSLGKTETVKTQAFYTIFLSSIIAMPFAFIDWHQINFISLESIGIEYRHIPLILLMSICYFAISISRFKSFQYGDLAVVIPFGYTKIIFSGLLGMIIFKNYPLEHEYIGYILIIISGVYMSISSKKE
jgi:S-adenosylmethionine uptake transporter